MTRILIVDDDKALVRSLEIHLTGKGHAVRGVSSLAEGRKQLAASLPEVVFLDLKLPDGDSRGFLSELREKHPETVVIMITGHQDMQATIEAVRLGAFDYIRKPLDLDQILATLEKAEKVLESRTPESVELSLPSERNPRAREIVGRAPAVLEILKQIAVLSESRVAVLIQGETGTGKELVARALHGASHPGRPFVAVNCAGIVSTLLESELFGHERGSFTGAEARKLGKMELAGEGTIFFDEIGDLSLDLQAKLLRALQEAEFERVGGTRPIPLKARVMAATHRDLERMLAEGTFRQDLFFRLAVAQIHVPPLRERPEDIPLLADFLLKKAAGQLGRVPARLSRDAVEKLKGHSWPGNVRELENVLMRAATFLRGEVIEAKDLPIHPPVRAARSEPGFPEPLVPLREMESQYVRHALDRMNWNITRTAEVLEVSPTTLRKKIADYGLRRGGPRSTDPTE